LGCALLWPLAARAAQPTGRPAPDFTLSDQFGHSFTLSRERGRAVVLFFGYAHCPDVCPTLLANLKSARASVGSDALVVFVTVDPARDRALDLRRFLAAFDPSFLGLTGSPRQLAPVYRAYHVIVEKQPGGGDDYLVSHTAFVYFIGRDGRIHGIGSWSDGIPILEEGLREIVRSGA